jgi:hypothetical protein
MIAPSASLTLLDTDEDLPKPVENPTPQATQEDASGFDPLFLQILEASGKDPESLNGNLHSVVNNFEYSNAEDGSVLVTSGVSRFYVTQQDPDQDGTVDSNKVSMVRSGPVDSEQSINTIIEGTQLYIASNPDKDSCTIKATDERAAMVMEKVAELSGLRVKNPINKDIDIEDPELAAKIEAQFEAYAQEHGLEVHKSWDFQSPNAWGPYRESFEVTDTGEVMIGDKSVTLQAIEPPEAGDTSVEFHALGENGEVLKDMDGTPITFILDNESVIEMAEEIDNPDSPLKEVAETVQNNMQAAETTPEKEPEQAHTTEVTANVSAQTMDI